MQNDNIYSKQISCCFRSFWKWTQTASSGEKTLLMWQTHQGWEGFVGQTRTATCRHCQRSTLSHIWHIYVPSFSAQSRMSKQVFFSPNQLWRKEKSNSFDVKLLCLLSIVHIRPWMGFSHRYYLGHTIQMIHPAGINFCTVMARMKTDGPGKTKAKTRGEKAAKHNFDPKKKNISFCSEFKRVFMRLSMRIGDATSSPLLGPVAVEFSGAANEEWICLMAVMLVQLNLACWFRSCLCYLWFMAVQ